MTIEIPSELRPFVEQELKAGRYASEQEVVNKALHMLQRERDAAVAGIVAGLADVESGQVQGLDETFTDLRNEFGIKDDS